MPAVSKAQQGFMGAELARKRAGKKTRTGMSEKQLSDYAKGYKHLGVIGSLPGSMPKQGASSNMSGGKSGKPKESPHGNRLPSNPHPPVRREGPGRAR